MLLRDERGASVARDVDAEGVGGVEAVLLQILRHALGRHEARLEVVEADAGALVLDGQHAGQVEDRGTRLFEEPSQDIRTIRARLGNVPIAGLFAAGEIGPIGGTSYLHGHTLAMGIIR